MIHDALRLIRQYHNLKQGELAQRLGMTPSHLSQIESGKRPVSYELLQKYSEVFNLPISSITLFAEASEANAEPSLREAVTRKALKLLDWLDRITELKDHDSRPAKSH